MATLDQIAAALKAADAAGNVDDAKRLAAAYKVMAAQQAASSPQPAPAPSPGVGDYASQGMSGVNEGIANTLGFPVQAVTDLLNLGSAGANKFMGTNLPQIEHPFGGPDTFKQLMAPTIKAESADPRLQMTRRVGQEMGAWAVPGMGAVAKAERPVATAAKELISAVGSGTGAAVAQQVAPDNPLAEFAGQIAGAITPAGIARMGKKKLPVPSVEDLRSAKTAAYAKVDNAGIAYSPAAYDRMLQGIVLDVQKDHISPTRHEAAYSFINDMIARRGKPLSLTELDQLRQEVRRDLITPSYGNPAKSADAHFGQSIVDHIDDLIGTAKPSDLMGGGSPNDAANAILFARSANVRYRKSEALADALYRAKLDAASSGSGGNINNAIRQQVKAILKSPKRRASFSAAEIGQMERLVSQGSIENLLRWVGKFSPGGNGLIGALEVVGTLHNPATAVLPVAGMVAKGMADRGTLAKVEELRRRLGAMPAPPRPPFMPGPSVLAAQGINQIAPH